MKIKTNICSLVIASVIAAMVIGINPFAFGQNSTNLTSSSNMIFSSSNSTASVNGGSGSQGNVHLDAAMKALQSGDKNGALMHMNEAAKTLTGAAKMHLDAAISALQSGDTNGATMHLQESQKNL